MGQETRTVTRTVSEQITVDICDGCGEIRERNEEGYYPEDGWTSLHYANRCKDPVILCPECTAKAQAAAGWK